MQQISLKILILFYGICLSFSASAQSDNVQFRGRIIDRSTTFPVEDAQLLLPQLKQIFSCDSAGKFSINSLKTGTYTIFVLINSELADSFKVSLTKADIDLGDIAIDRLSTLEKSIATEQASIPTIALESDPGNLEEEGISGNQNISVLLNSSGSRDPFLNAVSFVFGQYNFRARGYNRSAQHIYINGILMNDLNTGNAVWGQWSGLNDAFRNQNSSYGHSANQQATAGLNGSTNFDISAIEQSAQTKIAYSLSNRSYNNRIMLSRSSGVNKKGWAYSFSASRRWAQEGYIPGTSFDGYAAFISVGKVLNKQNQLSLSIIAANNTRARSGAAIEEVYSLANDHYYNPNWGWQNGEKRNARIAKLFQPIAILKHSYKPSEKTEITNSISYQTGRSQGSSLDWYGAIDPRPDYYRNLPSYYTNTNPGAANAIKETLENNPEKLQIDWTRLYNANRSNKETISNVNGHSGENYTGNRSQYVIGADVENLHKISLATNIQHRQSDHIIFTGGLQIIHQQSAYFKELIDLLGGDYFVNYNMFAAQQYIGNNSFRQNDLNTPDRAIKMGEKYKYHYTNTINKSWAWGQIEGNYHRVSFFLLATGGFTSYLRNGLYNNGLFPENSYGKSKTLSFLNYSGKAGISYKINGRNYLVLNTLISTEDPGTNNILIAPRTRNQTIDNPSMQLTKSIEAGYLLRAPKLNIRLMAYATDITNATSIQRFYNDDPEYQSFVNFVMTKVNTRFTGTEMAVEYAINTMLSVNAVAAIGQAFYTNRPNVQIYNDNDTNTNPGTKNVFIKNYYLGVGPQSAYTLGLSYNSKKYWYCKINANYFERNYVAVNPLRRSVDAAELVAETDPLFAKIFDQEQLPSSFTIDISGGKSFRLSKISKKIKYGTMMYFNFGMSNVLNNQNIKSVGFEQLRYDFTNNNPDKFPTKYIYGYGRSFFANVSIKF